MKLSGLFLGLEWFVGSVFSCPRRGGGLVGGFGEAAYSFRGFLHVIVVPVLIWGDSGPGSQTKSTQL